MQEAAHSRAEEWKFHARRHEGKIRQNIGPRLEGLVEHEVNQSEKPVPRLKAARDDLQKEGEPLMKSLEEAIHGALREGSISSLKSAA